MMILQITSNITFYVRSIRGKQTHPIIIEHASTNLVQNIPGGRFERGLYIDTGLGAGFDEQQTFFFRPELGFFGRNLARTVSR